MEKKKKQTKTYIIITSVKVIVDCKNSEKPTNIKEKKILDKHKDTLMLLFQQTNT